MRRTLILAAIALVLVLVVAFFAFLSAPPQGDGSADGGGGGFFGSLFPFNFGGGDGGGPSGSGTEEPIVDNRPVPTLRKISAGPSAGGFFFEPKTGGAATSSVGIRYIERETGHVYETFSDTLSAERVSNTTIPGIQSIIWQDKNRFLIRYLDDAETVQTFAVALADVEGEQAVDGSFLESWNRAALSPDRKSLVEVFETASGSRVERANADGSNRRVVFSSPIASWVPLQSNGSTFLQTAASSGISGFLYRLSGETLLKVVGDEPGLTAIVNPTGQFVLFSTGDENGVELFMYDTEEGVVHESPVDTLAGKCAFATQDLPVVVCGVPDEFPQGNYPNDWLLGRVVLSDDLWAVNPVGGVAELLSVPDADANVSLDVTSPFVDETGTLFGFINKNDLSLWSLNLSI